MGGQSYHVTCLVTLGALDVKKFLIIEDIHFSWENRKTVSRHGLRRATEKNVKNEVKVLAHISPLGSGLFRPVNQGSEELSASFPANGGWCSPTSRDSYYSARRGSAKVVRPMVWMASKSSLSGDIQPTYKAGREEIDRTRVGWSHHLFAELLWRKYINVFPKCLNTYICKSQDRSLLSSSSFKL